jgi:hypothetical protein
MGKIQVRAVVAGIEPGVYPRQDHYSVTIDCGQPFEQVYAFVGFCGYASFVQDKPRSQPEKRLLVLQMDG